MFKCYYSIMENYDEQIKGLILRLKFDIKLREFVSFLFLRHKQLLCLKDWIEILEKQQKYSGNKRFFDYLRYILHIHNEPRDVDIYLTNVFNVVKEWEVSDDLIIDILKFIDLKNYS